MSARDTVCCDYSQVQSMGSLILIGVLSLFHLASAQVTGMYYVTVWIVHVYSVLCMSHCIVVPLEHMLPED